VRAVSPAECARRGRRAVTNMRGRPRCELPLDLQENARAPRHSQWARADARPDQAAHAASRYTARAAPAAGLTQVLGQCRGVFALFICHC